MSEERAALRFIEEKPGQLTLPGVYASLAGALLAGVYAVFTLEIPEGQSSTFLVLVLAFSVVLAVTSDLLNRSRVKRLFGLSKGELRPTKEHLTEAVKELVKLPDFSFFNSLFHWAAGASGVALVFGLVSPEVEWQLQLRILALGVVFGPMTSLLNFFLLSLKTRELVEALGDAGLTPQEILAAAPPKRAQLRLRLVLFTAITALTPTSLTVDVSLTLAQRGMTKVVAELNPVRQREVAEEVRNRMLQSVLMLCTLVLGLAVASARLAGTALGRPLRRVAEEANAIANGKLSKPRIISAEDELGAVAAAFTVMQLHLTATIGQLKSAGLRIGTTTEQIVATSAKYEMGAAEQATSLNETSATTEELARSARQIADNAGAVSQSALQMLAAAKEGQTSAEAFIQSMGRMKQDNQAIADAVSKLSKRVGQIGKIVEFINGVADKSDLLALSAELEGTKAGEVGRGFSLVAAEMRRLAENVIESTAEIETLIEEIREATKAAVTATEAGLHATNTGSTLAESVTQSLKQIVQLAGDTSSSVRAISLATQQQQSGTDQLAEAMGDILRVTEQSLQATREVTTANGDLATLAQGLHQTVSRFKVEERS